MTRRIFNSTLIASTLVGAADKPNIVLVLCDDLGYGEVGFNGQNLIETPNIDALAKSGMVFNQHYSGAPVCAPARCTLLTGQHTGHSYIRGNDEWASRGDVWSLQAMNENPKLEGQRPLPDSIVTVAELLKKAVDEISRVFKKRNNQKLTMDRGAMLIPQSKQIHETNNFELITWLVIK